MIDAHCHLNFEDYRTFCDERKTNNVFGVSDILSRAETSGVTHIIAVGTNLDDSKKNIEIVNSSDVLCRTLQVFAGVGIHPDNADTILRTTTEQQLVDTLKKLAKDKKVVCLGECGLDYRLESYNKSSQIRMFEIFCQLSKELDLPLQIHSRYAETDTLDILLRANKPRGIMHCFSGSIEIAKKYLDFGLFLSFSGIATFKNANLVRETIKYVPLDMLLTETDAPFLAPVPHRGSINEPALIHFTAECIASIKGIDINFLNEQIAANFFHAFNRSKNL